MVRSLRQNGQGAWQAAATYLTGPRGMEYRRDDLAGTVRWYVYDGLGSVVGELDPSGNLTAGKKYDVYGAERSGGTGTATSRQGFCGSLGHVADAETGLVYMRARYYDPNLGRFESEDPAKKGIDWFVYCKNNPTCRHDNTGKEDTLVGESAADFDAAELDEMADKPPSQLLFATEHGAQGFYDWYAETFPGYQGSVLNLDDAIDAWDAERAVIGKRGEWVCQIELYNTELTLVASDDAQLGEMTNGIGRLVTAF